MSFNTIGFFYGYVGSAQPGAAPTEGDAYAFPGSFDDAINAIPDIGEKSVLPQGNDYSNKILTIGGGDTLWGDDLYSQVQAKLAAIKGAGWTGVCYDWETVGEDHTTEAFNELTKATRSADLLCVVTTTAEGPYRWEPADKDATGIDWDSVDYLEPQLYGGDGKAYPEADLKEYAQYWIKGAGTSVVSGVTFAAPAPDQLVWACVPGSVDYLKEVAPTSAGYTIWAYDPANE